MESRVSRLSSKISGSICGLIALCLLALPSVASAKYVTHVLVANSRKFGPRKVDPMLIDPWGIAHLSPNTFWVANQNTSVATAYTANGKVLPGTIQIPCVVKGTPVVPCTAAPDTPSFPPTLGPTGLETNIYAPSDYFEINDDGTTAPATLLFDTTDGLIVGWNPEVNRTDGIVAYASKTGAVYKGLALAPPNIGAYLYASNNTMTGGIDVFDQSFNLVNTFFPPRPSTNYHPHGVDIVGDQLYVTFAGMVPGGIVDVCYLTPDTATNPECHTLAYSTSAPYELNAPWGVTMAPSDFGKFSNDLLVGNVNSGYIVALDPVSGDFLGTLNNPNGTPISYRGIWDLDFEKGRNGKERMYFAAGPGTPLFSEGVFGFISLAGNRPQVGFETP